MSQPAQKRDEKRLGKRPLPRPADDDKGQIMVRSDYGVDKANGRCCLRQKPEILQLLLAQFKNGGVCWTMSELSLSKIQTPIDAKLLRNFAIGSRAKIFRGLKLLKPLQFLPARQKFFTKFFAPSSEFLKFMHITAAG